MKSLIIRFVLLSLCLFIRTFCIKTIGIFLRDNFLLFFSMRFQRISSSRCLSDTICHWKWFYLRQEETETNWLHNDYKTNNDAADDDQREDRRMCQRMRLHSIQSEQCERTLREGCCIWHPAQSQSQSLQLSGRLPLETLIIMEIQLHLYNKITWCNRTKQHEVTC